MRKNAIILLSCATENAVAGAAGAALGAIRSSLHKSIRYAGSEQSRRAETSNIVASYLYYIAM